MFRTLNGSLVLALYCHHSTFFYSWAFHKQDKKSFLNPSGFPIIKGMYSMYYVLGVAGGNIKALAFLPARVSGKGSFWISGRYLWRNTRTGWFLSVRVSSKGSFWILYIFRMVSGGNITVLCSKLEQSASLLVRVSSKGSFWILCPLEGLSLGGFYVEPYNKLHPYQKTLEEPGTL